MLKKVRIKNFLSCEDTEFDLENITVLIGRNAAGKTNVLKAIEKFSQCAVTLGDVSCFFSPTEQITEYSCEFFINDKDFKYDIKIKTFYNEQGAKTTNLIESLSCYEDNRWKLIADNTNCNSFTNIADYKNTVRVNIYPYNVMIPFINWASHQKGSTIEIENTYIPQIAPFLAGIKYYTLDSDIYKNVDDYSSSHINKEYYKKNISNKDLTVVMKILYLWNEDKETLKELQTLLGKNGLDVIEEIHIEEINLKSANDQFFVVGFSVANHCYVTYSQLSYGTQRVLAILLILLYDKSSVLLIEHPEDGIHSGLLRKLTSICVTYCKAYNKQLIIATHATEIIDFLENPKSIRLVHMTSNGTKVTRLADDLLTLIPEYLADGGTLSEFIESMEDR